VFWHAIANGTLALYSLPNGQLFAQALDRQDRIAWEGEICGTCNPPIITRTIESAGSPSLLSLSALFAQGGRLANGSGSLEVDASGSASCPSLSVSTNWRPANHMFPYGFQPLEAEFCDGPIPTSLQVGGQNFHRESSAFSRPDPSFGRDPLGTVIPSQAIGWQGLAPPDDPTPFATSEAFSWAEANDSGLRDFLNGHPNAGLVSSSLKHTGGGTEQLLDEKQTVWARDVVLGDEGSGYEFQVSKTSSSVHSILPTTQYSEDSSGASSWSGSTPARTALVSEGVVRTTLENDTGHSFVFGGLTLYRNLPDGTRTHLPRYYDRIFLSSAPSGTQGPSISVAWEFHVDPYEGRITFVTDPLS
jgi:hypothetical protein